MIKVTPEGFKEDKTELQKKLKADALMYYASNQPREASELIVNHIKNNQYIKTIRNDKNKEMWIYEEGIYKPHGATYIEQICREILKEAYTQHRKKEIIEKISAETFIEQKDFFNNQNEHINIIPVQNGLLNIETKELTEFTPNIYFFNKLPATFNPNQDCPAIKKFLKEVLPDEENIKVIQELFGFTLLKEYRYELAFFLLGEGRNGKSKVLNLLEKLIGKENESNVSLQQIETSRFALGSLHNKLVNISADISKQVLNNTGTYKNATGRDMLEADRKYNTSILFVNYAKFIFATNELPKTNDMTAGFFQRARIIRFDITFYKPVDYDLHKNEPNARLRNPRIIEEILTKNELDGLLNWTLEGLTRLQKNKEFSSTKTTKEIQNIWIRESDSAMSFIEEMIVEDYESFMTYPCLKREYKRYCESHKLKPLKDKDLKETLLKETVASYSSKNIEEDGKSKTQRGFLDVRLRNEGETQTRIN